MQDPIRAAQSQKSGRRRTPAVLAEANQRTKSATAEKSEPKSQSPKEQPPKTVAPQTLGKEEKQAPANQVPPNQAPPNQAQVTGPESTTPGDSPEDQEQNRVLAFTLDPDPLPESKTFPEEEGGPMGAGDEEPRLDGNVEALGKMVAVLAGQMGVLIKKVKEHDEMANLARGFIAQQPGAMGSPEPEMIAPQDGGNGVLQDGGKWLPYLDRLIKVMELTRTVPGPGPGPNPVEAQFGQVGDLIGQVFDIVDKISDRASKSAVENWRTYSKEFPSMLRERDQG